MFYLFLFGARALLFVLPLLAVDAWAATYYVRADGTVTAAGKASATSCSAASTALSMAEHNNATLTAGDDVVLCHEGGTFTSVMTARVSGVDANNTSNITSSAGGRATIDVRVAISTSGWTTVSAGVRYSLSTTNPERLWVNSGSGLVEWQRRESASEVDTAGEWYWESSTLYIGGTDPSTLTSIYGLSSSTITGLSTNAKSYLYISGIDVYGATSSQIGVVKGDYITINDVVVGKGKNGINISGDTSDGNNSSYITVQNSVIGESAWSLDNTYSSVNNYDGLKILYEADNVTISGNSFYNWATQQ